jgi:uncharacterized protein (UPF0212 family)
MCEYCVLENRKHNTEIVNKDFTQNYLFLDITNNKLHLEDNYNTVEVRVNYCPMCGQRLEE